LESPLAILVLDPPQCHATRKSTATLRGRLKSTLFQRAARSIQQLDDIPGVSTGLFFYAGNAVFQTTKRDTGIADRD
jgi:hypothetical protein